MLKKIKIKIKELIKIKKTSKLIFNPLLGTDFPEIEGTHYSERVDSDVMVVYANYANSRNFPPVIK